MKLQTTVRAPRSGRVREVFARVNSQVDAGAPLLRLDRPVGDEDGRRFWLFLLFALLWWYAGRQRPMGVSEVEPGPPRPQKPGDARCMVTLSTRRASRLTFRPHGCPASVIGSEPRPNRLLGHSRSSP